MFASIGYTEIIIVLVVLLILFGGSQLPKIARNLGQSGKELKKATKELKDVLGEDKK
jgi:sec-independent protein translocase protein TatA